jgi:hypothetical protein
MYKHKVLKSERIVFDGEYVTNGEWMLKAGLVKLSDATLESLKCNGNVFSYNRGTLLPGETIFTTDSVKPELQEKENYQKLFTCKMIYNDGMVLLSGDNVFSGTLNIKFRSMLDCFGIWGAPGNDGKPYQIKCDGAISGLVMPMRSTDIQETLQLIRF